MTSLRVGVIGAGVFGGYHAGKAAASDRATFEGVYDPHPARAAEIVGKLGGAVFEDEQALHAACDAVVVACPASSHEASVRAALEAGLHVLVEKPLALSYESADALVNLAEEKGRVIQVGHQERLVLAAMGFFDIEETPIEIEAVREGPPAPGGRAGDVSVIWDLMIHDLDMAAKLMGDGADVSASGEKHHSEHIDEATAQLSYEDGRSASIRASRAAANRNRSMAVTYPSGKITVDFLTRQVVNLTRHPIRVDVSDELPDPLGAADEAFFGACLGLADTPIPGRVAAEAVRLAEGAEESALGSMG